MWNKPWSLLEGFVIGAGLVAVGLVLQFTVGPLYWSLFAWPANIIILCLFVILLLALYGLGGKVYALRYLRSWQSAVAALCYAVGLTIIMGVTRQVTSESVPSDVLGLSKMLNFWPFCLVYMWIAAIVGQVAIRQLVHFSWRQLPSTVSHVGLFVVLVAGTLGSADMQRTKMFCEMGKPEWRVLDANGTTRELPVAIQLNRFILEEYPPKLMLIDNTTRRAVERKGKPMTLIVDSTFRTGQLADITITVVDRRSDDVITVRAVDAAGKKSEGIVACGNYMMPPQMMALGKRYSLAMAERDPKRYASEVDVMTKEGGYFKATIDVNHPISVAGWKIYQYGYNTQMGKYSNYSVLEFVTDPWLPAVYVGIGLLAIGALGLFLTAGGKRREGQGSSPR